MKLNNVVRPNITMPTNKREGKVLSNKTPANNTHITYFELTLTTGTKAERKFNIAYA